MENECVYKLKELQPSQFYISEKKLCDIESWFDPSDLSGFEPIPVKLLDGMPVMTDGHTRAVAALRAGLDAVPLVWDTDELDWDLYRFCVKECRKQNVLSPADLLDRIITADEYDEKWNKWCDIMHQQMHKIEVVQYTEERIPDVIEYELQLRAEESDWGWEINDEYKKAVKDSFKGRASRCPARSSRTVRSTSSARWRKSSSSVRMTCSSRKSSPSRLQRTCLTRRASSV